MSPCPRRRAMTANRIACRGRKMNRRPCAVRGTKMFESAHQSRAYDHSALESVEAREQLILEHLPQIKYIAQRISTKLPSHVELNDLVSAGVLGLLDAIEKFDPIARREVQDLRRAAHQGRHSGQPAQPRLGAALAAQKEQGPGKRLQGTRTAPGPPGHRQRSLR